MYCCNEPLCRVLPLRELFRREYTWSFPLIELIFLASFESRLNLGIDDWYGLEILQNLKLEILKKIMRDFRQIFMQFSTICAISAILG